MTTAVVYTGTDSSLTTMNAAEDDVETVTGSVEEIVDNDVETVLSGCWS